MKSVFRSIGIFVALSLLSIPSGSYGAENDFRLASDMMRQEFSKATHEYQKMISDINGTRYHLKLRKEKILAKYRALAKSEAKGIKLFKKYIGLLEVRYTDDGGEFDPDQPILKQDTKNINKLFSVYLKKTGLPNTSSAERAVEAMEEGIEELEELVDIHQNPDASNNSEIQIVENLMEKASERKGVLLELVSQLGLKGVKANLMTKMANSSPEKSSKRKMGKPAQKRSH